MKGESSPAGARVDRRRTDTRLRIQQTAMELFGERGYDGTSLREIAERLDVTKAAIYYHFKTKEEILESVITDLIADIDDLVAWAQAQPLTMESKEAILKRIERVVRGRWRPVVQLAQNIGPSFRDHPEILERLQQRAMSLMSLLRDPNAPLIDQLRALIAVAAVYFGNLPMPNPAIRMTGIIATDEEMAAATMELALELLSQAESASDAPGPTNTP